MAKTAKCSGEKHSKEEMESLGDTLTLTNGATTEKISLFIQIARFIVKR